MALATVHAFAVKVKGYTAKPTQAMQPDTSVFVTFSNLHLWVSATLLQLTKWACSLRLMHVQSCNMLLSMAC